MGTLTGDDESTTVVVATASAAAVTETTALLFTQHKTLAHEKQPEPNKKETRRGLVCGRAVSEFFERCFPEYYGRHASLSSAWDYLEENVLPRRLKTNTNKSKAASGTAAAKNSDDEDGTATELYPAWTTPQSALASFGTGIAVYFATLRILATILFIAYILSLPSIWFYASTAYDPENAERSWYDAPLRGSLMCRHTVWVPCLDCPVAAFPNDRLAVVIASSNEAYDATIPTTPTADGDIYHYYVLKNDCSPMRWAEGVNHMVVLVVVTICMIGLGFYQKKLELRYDESVLSASDFSIVVTNPPHDAIDVNEWKDYFESTLSSGGKVVYCTVAIDNGPLARALVERRINLLQAMYQDDTRKDYAYARTIIETVPDRVRIIAPTLAARCDRADAQCRKLLQEHQHNHEGANKKNENKKKKKRYGATRVYVTFETEKSQREALAALLSRDPAIPAFRNGRHILHVKEAPEPSVVRWSDLHATWTVRWSQRAGCCIVTIVFMYLSLQTVWYAFRNCSVEIAALVVAMFSSSAHTCLGYLNRFERHEEESSYQASLFCKLMAFRFVNTVVTTTLITPFTETVGEKRTSLIPAIYAVLQAEVIVAPLANMMDPVGHCNRLFLAPFAKNQPAMNSYFKGSPENFGNKYTNMTKIVFLCFFYATIFPSGLLFGSVALVITYFTDKFLLLRTWAPIPELGNNIAWLSRRVVFPLCLIVLLLMSELYWSAYPFDDVCETDETVGSRPTTVAAVVGVHNLTSFATRQTVGQVVVDENDRMYHYCDQNYLVHLSGLLKFFEIQTGDWMSDDQQYLTYLFGLVCVTFGTILVLVECRYEGLPAIQRLLVGKFHTTERDSNTKFGDQRDIRAYVPQVTHPLLSFPLLACDIEGIEPSRIGWTDAAKGHMYYSLQKDVEYLTNKKPLDFPVLSIVRRWE